MKVTLGYISVAIVPYEKVEKGIDKGLHGQVAVDSHWKLKSTGQ
jgi:hypothetical protein